MTKEVSQDVLEVGVVIGIHGLRGDMKVRPLPTGALALPKALEVSFSDGEGQLVAYRVVRSSPHKQNFLLRLAGLESLAAVEPLVGKSVFMTQVDLPRLPDDQFYWTDIDGFDVVDQRLGLLGQIVGMFTTPAHDILEVDGPRGEILIPAIEPFVVACNRANGQLHVNLPDGLVPDSGESA